MPTPDQTRLTLSRSMTGMEPASLTDQRRDIAIEQAVNRLPFFVEYDNRFQFPTEETVVGATSAADMEFDTDGLFYVDFDKYESWTDIKVRIHMTGFVATGGTGVSIEGYVTDQAEEVTAIPVIARFYFNNASEHHSFFGERRVENLLPGSYRFQFQWSVTANSFRFDERDTVYASVTEMIPIPSVGE